MSLESMREIADAVLLEGYALYPYRASATKNKYRWQFGVVVPPAHAEADWSERSQVSFQSLVEGGPTTRIRMTFRFLHLRNRTVESWDGAGYQQAESLVVGDRLFVPWEEGKLEEVTATLSLGEGEQDLHFPACVEEEAISRDGERMGRILREAWDCKGQLRWKLEEAATGLLRLDVRVSNTGTGAFPTRDLALRHALLSSHLLFSVEEGAFVSSQDPPAPWEDAARACKSDGLYPVLGGEEGSRNLLIASPIILYDHPQIAPESHGDFFDACEIDELLVLRTSTLTEAEKMEMRGTDPRTDAILRRVEDMTPEQMARLHGAIRQGPAKQEALPGPGEKVRVLPSKRRTDAQDMLYVGRVATVEKILEDVDGSLFLAVTLDDDPGSDLHRSEGRFWYYYPDEVELVRQQGVQA